MCLKERGRGRESKCVCMWKREREIRCKCCFSRSFRLSVDRSGICGKIIREEEENIFHPIFLSTGKRNNFRRSENLPKVIFLQFFCITIENAIWTLLSPLLELQIRLSFKFMIKMWTKFGETLILLLLSFFGKSF